EDEKNAARKQLQNVVFANISVTEGVIVSDEGIVISASDFPNADHALAQLDDDDGNFKNGAFSVTSSNSKSDLIAVVKNIYKEQSTEKAGVVILFTDKNQITDYFKTDLYNHKERYVLLDTAGKLVFQSEGKTDIPIHIINESIPKNAKKHSSTLKLEEENNQYIVNLSSETGWKAAVFVPESVLYKHSVDTGNNILVYICIILILGVVFTTVTTLRITKPITRLADAIDRVAAGDFKHKIAFSEKNEITYIADNFNNMVDEIQDLTKKIFSTQQRLYETELERKQYELSLLQSQINSHFLYNTLSCIRAMSRKGATEEVSAMISSLVNMLRYASNVQEKSVLQDEYQNIKNYFYIQRMRLGEQLQLIFDENDDIIYCEVPKMILQPVVENSILHGFTNKKGEWRVRVRAERENECLKITISDNGCGMSSDRLEALNASLAAEKSIFNTVQEKPSIGLVNIQNRVRSLYGDAYGVCVRSWRNVGTAVIIRTPYKRSDEYVFRAFD
ncbi:MAG: sensor histidine kinase, partial [Clostridia bacterium]|nr:sensor histidine kinase [Clostridia bacterium]